MVRLLLQSGLTAAVLSVSLMLTASAVGQASDTTAPRSTSDLEYQQGRAGMEFAGDRPAHYALDQHRRIESALAGVKPQRKGVVDAYVLVAGLDSDPLFGREVLAARDALSRRYDAAGHTIAISAGEEAAKAGLANGTPDHLALALGRIAEVMDKQEDVLVLYTTSHGSPFSGIAYQDKYYGQGYGAIGPDRLARLVNDFNVKNRIVIISACYSGIFVPALASDNSVIITAAAKDQTSFGCAPGNDWTYFGDAIVNHAMRKPQGIETAYAEAKAMVAMWEIMTGATPSFPQLSVGKDVNRWLVPLEARMPKTTDQPVGRPSFVTSMGR